jgi:hypothetical protein
VNNWLSMVIYVDLSKLISNFCLTMCEFHVLILSHKIFWSQMRLRKARNVLVAFIGIWFNIILECMHKWADQFGNHVSQFCLVIAIAMPMLLYRSWNLLKWTWFKDFNLNIYMIHKIILTFELKIHGMYIWLPFLCGLWYSPLIYGVCVRGLKLVKYHNNEAKGKK